MYEDGGKIYRINEYVIMDDTPSALTVRSTAASFIYLCIDV